MKKLFFIGVLSIVSLQLECVVAVGDTPDSSSTFQFSVGSAIYNAVSMQTWTVSGQDLSSFDSSIQKYGISYTPFIFSDNSSGTAVLKSYPNVTTDAIITEFTSALVVLPSAVNPLLGQAYTALTLVGTAPTIVCASEPETVYMIESVAFSDKNLGLTSADGTSVVNKLSYADSSEIAAIGGIGSTNLFVAYAQGSFGSTGSTLSYVQLTSQQDVTTTTNDKGEVVSTVTNYSCLQEQASALIAVDTPVLKANTADLSKIGSSVAMYPSGNKMYIGLDINSGVDTSACGVGLFTATGVNSAEETPGSLTLESVIPDTVVTNAGKITTVVSVPNNARVVIRNVTTTKTSTGLGYLMVSQDNGVDQQSIYAMPMVTMPASNSNFGKIAAFDSVESIFKISGSMYRTQGFSQVISDAGEININGTSTVQARLLVGGGFVPVAEDQYISQMIAQGDSVYIVVSGQFSTGTTPGVFKSDALFDETGRIMSWTRWQRVAGTDQQVLFAMNNKTSGATMFVSASVSASDPVFNTIQQTTWSSSADLSALSKKITSYLPKIHGGVQGNFAFPRTTEGFTKYEESQVSLLVTTGKGNVLVAQTGWLVDDNFQILPQTDETSIVIDATLGLSIGSVVTADFGNDGVGNNWLFMGGDQGLAVISADDGSGFEFLPNKNAAASLINAGQTCKTLGNFKFVKKIVSAGNYLYVMTQDAVYQILLLGTKFTASNPAALDADQLISATQLAPFAYCLDMLIDNRGLILLGTTAGLYSINIAVDSNVVISIDIPQGLSSVSKLQTLSSGANVNDFYTSSNLYLLSIDYATLQARLNRFVIVNGVVTPIQDQLVENQNGPLLIFDYMNNNMFIDGSLGYMTAYKMGTQPATIKYLQYTLQAGISGRHAGLADNTSNVVITSIAESLNIAGIARDFASGCLMLAADFGLLTLS